MLTRIKAAVQQHPRIFIFSFVALLFASSSLRVVFAINSATASVDTCQTVMLACSRELREVARVENKYQASGVLGTVKSTKKVTFDVAFWGNIAADREEFVRQATETLNDTRGWFRAGLTFGKVESGGNFTLVLAEPARVAGASPGCSAVYSCQVGRYVIINDERWRSATTAWTGTLRDYRHMVVNHETGHWIGHGHPRCPGASQPAPVMMQQSIDLQGCLPNPWPTQAEINSTVV